MAGLSHSKSIVLLKTDMEYGVKLSNCFVVFLLGCSGVCFGGTLVDAVPRIIEGRVLYSAMMRNDGGDSTTLNGYGLGFNYGWKINPRFSVSIDTTVRHFEDLDILGYGLRLSHRVYGFSAEALGALRVYYGLLMRMNWVDDREGLATSHDTELGIQYDYPIENYRLLIQASYSLSKLRFFETEPTIQNTINLGLGLAF
jgi:hypothetical protein